MTIVTALPIAVLRLQYTIVRIPLEVIDDQLLSRLTPHGPARLLYQRSLTLLDRLVLGATATASVPTTTAAETHPDRHDNAPEHEPGVDDEKHTPAGDGAENHTVSTDSDHKENADLNENAARTLDRDLLASQLEDIEAAHPTTPAVLTQFTDAATTPPDTALTPELAHWAAELTHTEVPPGASKTPDDPGFVPTDDHH
ncbi:hypothetical protein EEB14_56205 [Rhodococcus sp. WS4]|nr:hypothetical protein EEB14_56205 [Rhodococcus sp. WS4]